MARNSGDDLHAGGGGQQQQTITHFDAHSSGKLDVPSADFVAHAGIARDGQDLVLTAPDGSVVIIDGYFSADPAPVIFAPDGTALTPQLVESFVHGAGALQYAEAAGGVSDVSPVGAVHEVHGKATVTHPDGTTETIVPGTAIYQGDIVETEGDGAVEIGFVDESSFAVSADARLAIDEFVFDASSQGGESNFSMLRGMFVYTSGLIGREDPDDVKIGTPVGSIGIRGTVIAGNVDSGEITVVEGAIVLRDLNGNEVTLAGQFDTAKFAPGGDLVSLPATSGTELAAKFVSMNSVAPAFFSTIGSTPDAQNDDSDEPSPESDGSNDTPADAPTQTPTAPTNDQSQMDPAIDPAANALTMDAGTTGFDGATDSFSGTIDTFAATETSSTASVSTGTDPVVSSFSAPSVSDGTSTQSTSTSSTTTTTSTSPSVINAAPVITNGMASYTMAENSAASTAVGAVTASDAEGNSLTYSIVAGNTGGAFSIDSAGMIHVAGTLDFETLATYTLTVRVSDGIEFTDAQYTVSLTDANDTPTMAAATFTIAENAGTGAAVGSVTATDQDLDVLSFSETGNGTGAGLFQIDAAGNITVSTGATLNFEVQSTYTYEVQVNDGSGGVTTRTMDINLSDLNDNAPVVVNNTGLTANEGGAAVTLTAAMLSATDADAGTPAASLIFTVDSIPANGLLRLNGTVMAITDTFTMADIVAGRVTYTHGGSETASDSFTFSLGDGTNTGVTGQSFNITINAVNDVPVMTAATFHLDENSIGGAVVGSVIATDAEGDTPTYTETGGTGSSLFEIDSSGNITVTADVYLDYEATASYTYQVQVIDGNGGISTATMTIDIDDVLSETITGSTGNNTLIGDIGDDVFIVNNGDDTIVGAGQFTADTYDATAATNNMVVTINAAGAGTAINGADTDTFTGIERIVGGMGNDSFIVNNKDALIDFDAGAGTADLLDFSALSASNNVTVDLGAGTVDITGGTLLGAIAGFERVNGTDGGDAIDGATDAAANVIEGRLGDDTLTGGDNDALLGGGGNDALIITSDNNIALDGGAGTDTLHLTASAYDFDNLNGITGIEEIDMQLAGVTLNLSVTAGIFANDTSNLIINMDGDDMLNLDFSTFGGGGNFVLVSGALSGTNVAQFHNSVTGNNLTINYAGSGITQTGAGPASTLYLNTLAGTNGFTIRDDIGEGFGNAIAGLGDLDNDGFDDIGMVKATGVPGDGKVFLLHGQTSQVDVDVSTYPLGDIHDGLFNGTLTLTDGMTLAAVGDFNGDGVDDYVVGASLADSTLSGSGNAQIVDGSTGDVILELDGMNAMDMTGRSVAGIGDVNGDGYADVLVGASRSDANGGDSGAAHIIFGGNYPVSPVNTVDVTQMMPHNINTFGLTSTAKAMAYDSGSDKVVVIENGQVSVVTFDASMQQFGGGGATVPNAALNNPVAVALDEAADKAYVITQNGTFSRIDYSGTATVDGSFSSPSSSNAIDISIRGSDAYVLTAAGKIAHLTGINGTIADAGFMQGGGSDVVLTGAEKIVADGTDIYVMVDNGAGSGLYKIDQSGIATPSVEHSGGIYAGAVDVAIKGNLAYVLVDNGGGARLEIINTSTNTNVGTISPGMLSMFAGIVPTSIAVNGNMLVIGANPDGVGGQGMVMTFDVSGPNQEHPMFTGMWAHNMLNDAPDVIVAGSGGNFTPVVLGAGGTLVSVETHMAGMTINGLSANDMAGMDVSAAGDFNNDGISDFMISVPKTAGAGEVYVVYGKEHMGAVDLTNPAQAMKITGVSVSASADIPLFDLGDINGDGISDIAVASTAGQGQLHVIFGDAMPPSTIDVSTLNGSNGGFNVWTDVNHDIIGAGVTGDFNGDGFDDFVIATQNNITLNDVDIFVVYGGNTVGGTGLGWGDLTNAAKAFHMTYTIPNGADTSNFNIRLSAAGDLDGDGYYDLVIGLPNVDATPGVDSDLSGGTDNDNDGISMVVYGRDTGTGDIVTDNDGVDADVVAGSVRAAANQQVLIGGDGNDTMDDGGNADIVFRGGAGGDTINLHNGSFNDIDGGGGIDTLAIFSPGGLDFSSFSAEEISRVEGIDLTGTGQLLQLTMRNIFDLMGSSDTGTLSITSSGGIGNTLEIDNPGPGTQSNANENQIATMLGADAPAVDGGLYWAFSFGSYELQIDKTLVTNNDVNIV